ncbi:hypothetical protein NQZ68_021152 [Xyrichtys novacula]|uniref:Uncharacterized protein n=1 Tax=Xyrichtys novacula TaxID=13765 RepID=A0AAV1F1H0_XYRNO|nr:hypothetical protein NQZ68_021152 [Xyrichtys novacula]
MAWRRPPPAATEDNYTNTDKSASTVTHSRVGVLPYATSYHLQRLCKTERKLASQEPDTKVNGVPRAGETRDDGKRKRMGSRRPQSLSPRHTEVRKITQVS